jgi:hypothetical protein
VAVRIGLVDGRERHLRVERAAFVGRRNAEGEAHRKIIAEAATPSSERLKVFNPRSRVQESRPKR